jgi:hypothetical protein
MSGDRGGNLDDVYGQQMRAGVQALSSEQDINDVLAYVSTMN